MKTEYTAITDDIRRQYRAELKALDLNNGIPTVELLKTIIQKHRAKKEHMIGLYERYMCSQDGVPIYSREFEDESAINNQINNDYFGELVNTKVGYFAGAPFSYSYSQVADEEQDTPSKGGILAPIKSIFSRKQDEVKQTQADIDHNQRVISDFVTRNNMADKDLEITKLAEICGYCGRLLYINMDGEEAVKVIEPWECVILSDTEMTEPRYAIWYYDSDIYENGMIKTITTVEFYNNKHRYVFEDGLEGFVLKEEPQEHLFDYCPLHGIPNNRELLGGAEKILALVDGIDRTISDCNSEVEAFKLAYLLVYGATIDKDTLTEAKRTGCFNIPPMGATESKIEYLTKQINDTFIENHLNRLERNIYKFGQTPDMNEMASAGLSGIAMKLKLFPLETRCIMFERKIHSANMYMFKCLASAWEKKQIRINPLEVVIQYKRTYPIDLQYESQVLATLKGNVSDHTALGLLSFVDDVQYEIDLMEKEKESIPDIDFGMEEQQEETESNNMVDGRSNPTNIVNEEKTEEE